MKRTIYFLVLAAFLSSCSTSEKIETASTPAPVPAPDITTASAPAPAPVPPAEITFTQFENYKSFASLQMPMNGKGFGNEINYNKKTDAGENVPSSRYRGGHLIINSDFSGMITIDGDNSDINTALEAFQKSIFLRSWLKKDEINEQYSDVVLAGKTCKRFLVTYGIHREDYSAEFYKFGYIIPHQNTTAFFFMDSGGISSPDSFEKDIEVLDSVFTYMIETVEFREKQ